MKKNDLICYAIFICGVALYYGTQKECDALAEHLDGAKVSKYEQFK